MSGPATGRMEPNTGLTVYKYPLELTDVASVVLPIGAKILCVQAQHGKPQLWALVDPIVPDTETHRFRIAGTGHPAIPADATYIDTFQMSGGALVFHVFELVD